MDEIETLANAPLARKTFNFADMIRDRTYPEIVIPAYIDEAKALRLVEIGESEASIDRKIARQKNAVPTAEHLVELTALNEERERIVESMRGSKYMITVRGFSQEDRRALLDTAFEDYPVRYNETTNPITGALVKTEIEEPQRVIRFQDLLWNKALVHIVAPDGAVADPMNPEETHSLRMNLPTATRDHVDIALEKVQMASDWYKNLADEVF